MSQEIMVLGFNDIRVCGEPTITGHLSLLLFIELLSVVWVAANSLRNRTSQVIPDSIFDLKEHFKDIV